MTKEKTANYYGWANYETWLVNLWLSNDEGSYRHWRERACEIFGNSEDRPSAITRLGDEIREVVHEQCGIKRASLASDLMNAALDEVDWFEIAGDLLEEAEPATPSEPSGSASLPLGRVVVTASSRRTLR